MNNKLILSAFTLLAILGLYKYLSEVETQVLPFKSAEDYEMLKERLKTHSVWFEDLGKNRIRVVATDVELVFEIAEEAINEIIPKGRSRSPAKNILSEVILRLKFENIPFTTRCYDNTKWLVWEAEYTRRIDAIFEEVKSEIAPPDFGGLAECA